MEGSSRARAERQPVSASRGYHLFRPRHGFGPQRRPCRCRGEVDKLKELRAALERANQSYWAEQVEVQMLAASAWIAQQGGEGEALKFMRTAADLEDDSEKHIAMENRLYPMRELLGDLLLEQQQPGPALTEYETSLYRRQPAARLVRRRQGGESANQPEKATAYFRKLAEMTKDADADRVEISEAKLL